MTVDPPVLLTHLSEIEPLVPAWRDLLADCATDELVLTPEWLLTWWAVFGGRDGRQLRFVRLDEGGNLVGLAPLLSRQHWYRPGIPFRRLEPLATGEREEDAICSDYLTVLARRGREEEVAAALVRALASGRLGGWDELVIPLMNGEQAMTRLLAGAGQSAGLLVEESVMTRAPYIPLPPTWEEYLQRLGKKERYLVNRSLRDFTAWADGDWRLEAVTPASLEEGKKILHALHHERWHGTNQGVFRSPRFLAFHDRVMPQLLAGGALELLWLVARGQPVAAMYNLRWQGKTSFYQCGRTLDVPAPLRPGGVLLALAIRRAIDQGQREFDFLGGDALYKKQLALAERPLVQLRLARRCLVESARRVAAHGKNALRPLWRRLRGRTGQHPGGT